MLLLMLVSIPLLVLSLHVLVYAVVDAIVIAPDDRFVDVAAGAVG